MKKCFVKKYVDNYHSRNELFLAKVRKSALNSIDDETVHKSDIESISCEIEFAQKLFHFIFIVTHVFIFIDKFHFFFWINLYVTLNKMETSIPVATD